MWQPPPAPPSKRSNGCGLAPQFLRHFRKRFERYIAYISPHINEASSLGRLLGKKCLSLSWQLRFSWLLFGWFSFSPDLFSAIFPRSLSPAISDITYTQWLLSISICHFTFTISNFQLMPGQPACDVI